MKKRAILSIATALAIVAGVGLHHALAVPPESKEQVPQAWLKQLAGEWDVTSRMLPGPGQEKVESRSTDSARMLGNAWVISESRQKAPGGETVESILTLGYNSEKKKFVASFVCSMSTHLWTYEGALDESGRRLTLEAEGPAMLPGKSAKYRDIIEIKSGDHGVHRSLILDDKGEWIEFVTADYKRKK